MTRGLVRRYGCGNLHFITCSCYRRLPLLCSVRARNHFVQILGEVRGKFGFALVGYVVMPEHVHLLIGEPPAGTPSDVMRVLKQRVSRSLRSRRRKRISQAQLQLWEGARATRLRSFWQRRFYDFNVWSRRKRNEKLNYMHMNPVKRGLVRRPNDWAWSSYRFYMKSGTVLLSMDIVE